MAMWGAWKSVSLNVREQGKCAKGLPKPLSDETGDGYMTCHRRDTSTHGIHAGAGSIPLTIAG